MKYLILAMALMTGRAEALTCTGLVDSNGNPCQNAMTIFAPSIGTVYAVPASTGVTIATNTNISAGYFHVVNQSSATFLTGSYGSAYGVQDDTLTCPYVPGSTITLTTDGSPVYVSWIGGAMFVNSLNSFGLAVVVDAGTPNAEFFAALDSGNSNFIYELSNGNSGASVSFPLSFWHRTTALPAGTHTFCVHLRNNNSLNVLSCNGISPGQQTVGCKFEVGQMH
jgi:hypothetical protein